MKSIINGLSYAFNRNIGWQDKTIRTVFGITAAYSAFYIFKTHASAAGLLGIVALAQVWTVLSSRCIICYFMGKCTISSIEQKALEVKGIPFEK